MEEVFRDFAAHRKDKPDSEAVQALVARWQETITRRYYPCTKEILSGLGEMYIADPRFTQSIDRYADGLAPIHQRRHPDILPGGVVSRPRSRVGGFRGLFEGPPV